MKKMTEKTWLNAQSAPTVLLRRRYTSTIILFVYDTTAWVCTNTCLGMKNEEK